ncbi:MAG: ABC transporter ATP-binding protein [Dehalococcoidales bacterium]|nr:ABC transporter ATP-binding protein [Dehalococcoidales bacterium]
MEAKPVIVLKDIAKTYLIGKSQLPVLRGINLRINQGEMVAIMGPSGSGKSTLLNILGCLDVPTSGSYQLEGREVSRLSRGDLARIRGQRIGFIFQNFNLLPRLSAQANVELGLKYADTGNSHSAKELLSTVGLADRVRHHPMELSGGEQQRVAVARALVKNPAIVLADEPTGNLDSKSGEGVMSIIIDLQTKNHITLIMITHDRQIATYCRRIIHLKDGLIDGEETL